MKDGPLAPVEETDRRLMSADPPAATLRWLLDVAGGSDVLHVGTIPGGSTCAMHRVTIRSTAGAERELVLRRYVLDKILAEDSQIATHEMQALRLAQQTTVPTPEPIASDENGSDADVPALVLSFLAGRAQWEPLSRQRLLDQLVDSMLQLGEVQVPAGHTMRHIARYGQQSYEPPSWSERPGVWDKAISIFLGPVPEADLQFIHRDFHPGNVLWRGGRLTGLVDWQAACIGPASMDPGHCRLNMLRYDRDVARRLRLTWERQSGRTYNRWADIMSIIGTLDTLRTPKRANRALLGIEDTLARAVAELTP